MNYRSAALLLMSATALLADQVVLRDGSVVSGSYLGGDARTIRIAVADHVNTYHLMAVRSISFGNDQTSSVTAQSDSKVSTVVLPASTSIIVNTIDPGNSDQYAIRTKFKGDVKVPFLLRDPLHVSL